METKSYLEFSKNRTISNGYSKQCKNCSRENLKSWRNRNLNKRKEYANDYYRTVKGKAVKIIASARNRAAKNNISFNLQTGLIEHLLNVGKCQKSGLKLENNNDHNGIRNPFSPSLDRIDNSIGYEPYNIQIVCNMYNMGKNEFDELDFIAMCIGVAEKNKNNQKAIARYKLLSGGT